MMLAAIRDRQNVNAGAQPGHRKREISFHRLLRRFVCLHYLPRKALVDTGISSATACTQMDAFEAEMRQYVTKGERMRPKETIDAQLALFQNIWP